jgi:gamma-glutamyltranspeptidase / glutathione hydrolase
MNAFRIVSTGLSALALSVALLAPSGGWAQSKQLLEYPSIHHPVVGTTGMVVSQNVIASQIGADLLRQGGNAVDAAVGVAFALAVTLPRAGNLGGDGFMMIHLAATDRTLFIDYRGVAPKAAKLETFVDAKGKERNEIASFGYKASTVPGTVAGLSLAHKTYGKLSWKAVIEPAYRLASEGVVLSPDEAFVFSWGKQRLSVSEAGKSAFYKPDGSLYVAGEVLKQPDLAWTLDQISQHGADAFYRGEIARRFVADMKANGGLISEDDLASYTAVVREPLVGDYRGYRVMTSPPASAGGATLIEMLNILEPFDLRAGGAGSARSLHLLAETMKLGYADRFKYLGDTDFAKVPLRGFTSKAYAAERAKRINLQRATPVKTLGIGDPWAFESHNTTHFSVVDREGNAVSNTYTLGSDFGSGVMVAGAGFVLNNQMNNYSHEAAWLTKLNGGEPHPNAMVPGKRVLSTMMPTMVFKDGKPWLITGTPGGSTIIDTVLQVIVNVVDFDLNIAEATHQPRIYQGTSDTLELEPNFNPDTVAALKAMGHPIHSDETMGSAQSIMIEGGLFLGAADPRRPGALAIAP